MKYFIQRRLRKDTGIFKFLENNKGQAVNGDKHYSHENQNSNLNMGYDLLNEKKERKGMKDINIAQ